MSFSLWLGFALVVTVGTRFLSSRYIYGLRRFNGPFLASFTNAWRFCYNWRNTKVPYKDLHDRYGDIVRIGPNALSFRDPQAIRDIYGAGKNWDKSEVYSVNASVARGRSAHTLFSSTDPTWHRHVRRAMNNFFTQTAVLAYEPFVERTIEVFVTEMDNRFVNKHGIEGNIDFHTWMSYFTFDVISDLTYSKRHGFISRGEDVYGIIGWVADFLSYGFVVGQMPLVDIFLRHNPVLLWLERQGWYAGNTFPGVTFAIERISERQREREKAAGDSGDRREDLLDKFRRAKSERPEHITDKEVLSLSLTTMLAGAEASAISLTAVFYYVLRTPGCYSKLQEELDTHLQSASSATNSTYFQTPYSAARKLPYLHACIQEASRLHPSTGLMPERIVPPSGATICGELIPGGTIVGSYPWVVQRHKKTFGEDCDSYRPERWLADSEGTRKMERAMLLFGAGNHVCLGQYIALMEVYKLVPSLMRTYEMSLVDPAKEWKVINSANMTQTDVYVRIKRRSDL